MLNKKQGQALYVQSKTLRSSDYLSKIIQAIYLNADEGWHNISAHKLLCTSLHISQAGNPSLVVVIVVLEIAYNTQPITVIAACSSQ